MGGQAPGKGSGRKDALVLFCCRCSCIQSPKARNRDESKCFLESIFLFRSNTMGSSVSFSVWKLMDLEVPVFCKELKMSCQEELKVLILPSALFPVG